jgi:hypothetical protein
MFFLGLFGSILISILILFEDSDKLERLILMLFSLSLLIYLSIICGLGLMHRHKITSEHIEIFALGSKNIVNFDEIREIKKIRRQYGERELMKKYAIHTSTFDNNILIKLNEPKKTKIGFIPYPARIGIIFDTNNTHKFINIVKQKINTS